MVQEEPASESEKCVHVTARRPGNRTWSLGNTSVRALGLGLGVGGGKRDGLSSRRLEKGKRSSLSSFNSENSCPRYVLGTLQVLYHLSRRVAGKIKESPISEMMNKSKRLK